MNFYGKIVFSVYVNLLSSKFLENRFHILKKKSSIAMPGLLNTTSLYIYMIYIYYILYTRI